MRLFVDTSGWVALFYRDDKYHASASRAFRLVTSQRNFFFTTDYVLDETITHLRYACGHEIAVQFGKWVLDAQYITKIRIDEALWVQAWNMFQLYNDKEWALTDCTSFVVMKQKQLWQAFTFDHHFAQAGFQLWPG